MSSAAISASYLGSPAAKLQSIHTVTKIKKKTSRQKAILYSSTPAPDLTKDSRSLGKHSATPLPDFSSFWPRSQCHPGDPILS